uniref:Defensin-like protein n=1 Tax=Aegilops tauschii TaxID=37682 RepID=N1R2M1_AEGTA
MALAMSPCFGQGGGNISCLVVCEKLPGCTLDKCKHSCVTSGITNFTATCGDLKAFESCCCKYNCKRVPPV